METYAIILFLFVIVVVVAGIVVSGIGSKLMQLFTEALSASNAEGNKPATSKTVDTPDVHKADVPKPVPNADTKPAVVKHDSTPAVKSSSSFFSGLFSEKPKNTSDEKKCSKNINELYKLVKQHYHTTNKQNNIKDLLTNNNFDAMYNYFTQKRIILDGDDNKSPKYLFDNNFTATVYELNYTNPIIPILKQAYERIFILINNIKKCDINESYIAFSNLIENDAIKSRNKNCKLVIETIKSILKKYKIQYIISDTVFYTDQKTLKQYKTKLINQIDDNIRVLKSATSENAEINKNLLINKGILTNAEFATINYNINDISTRYTDTKSALNKIDVSCDTIYEYNAAERLKELLEDENLENTSIDGIIKIYNEFEDKKKTYLGILKLKREDVENINSYLERIILYANSNIEKINDKLKYPNKQPNQLYDITILMQDGLVNKDQPYKQDFTDLKSKILAKYNLILRTIAEIQSKLSLTEGKPINVEEPQENKNSIQKPPPVFGNTLSELSNEDKLNLIQSLKTNYKDNTYINYYFNDNINIIPGKDILKAILLYLLKYNTEQSKKDFNDILTILKTNHTENDGDYKKNINDLLTSLKYNYNNTGTSSYLGNESDKRFLNFITNIKNYGILATDGYSYYYITKGDLEYLKTYLTNLLNKQQYTYNIFIGDDIKRIDYLLPKVTQPEQ